MGLLPDETVANTCSWGALAGRPPRERADLFLSLLRRAGARAEVAEYPDPGSDGRAREEAVQFLTGTTVSSSP